MEIAQTGLNVRVIVHAVVVHAVNHHQWVGVTIAPRMTRNPVGNVHGKNLIINNFGNREPLALGPAYYALS